MTEYPIIKDFQKFNSNSLNAKLEIKRLKKLNETTKKWIFDLFERNMRKIYEASQEGWNEEEKRIELFDVQSYYLIATDVNNNKPIGYCHYRYDMDDECEVIYWYIILLNSSLFK